MIAETIPQLVQGCENQDPHTAINASMVCTLVAEGKLRSTRHGNRTILNRALVAEDIASLLGIACNGLPHLRSIRSAVCEACLRSEGIGEERLRDWVKAGAIPSIRIGTREYIALESLTQDALAKLECYTFSQPKKNHLDEEYEKVRKRIPSSPFQRIRK